MEGSPQKEEDKVVEIRSARKIFVCRLSTVDEDWLVGDLVRQEAAKTGPGVPIRVVLNDESVEAALGPILRFYESETLKFVPKEDEKNLRTFATAARKLRPKRLIEACRDQLFIDLESMVEVNEQEGFSHPLPSSSLPPVVSASANEEETVMAHRGSDATEQSEATELSETETPSPNSEHILDQIMERVCENEAAEVQLQSGKFIHGGELPSREAKEEEDDNESGKRSRSQELNIRIKALENEIEQLEISPSEGESGSVSPGVTIRELERRRVDLQRLKYERDQAALVQRNSGKKLEYNLLVVGVTGTGKSSSLNTLLDKDVCRVSGGQAQGTRGCHMQDGFISDESFVSFIDTQGLGADTSVTDAELLSQIMMSTESISRMRIINNVLISFDTNTRATPATMANQLTLMELFGELRPSCFLILTKWNTPSVQMEWNKPLLKWTKAWRRARTLEDITEDPPTYQEMYEAYCKYIMTAMNNDEDAGAFSKMGTFLSFFEGRLLFMYNLDALQMEDLKAEDLDPHIEKMYYFYRQKALETLRNGSTMVQVEELSFLKEDNDTLKSVASRLVASRDEKIRQLEQIGYDTEKRHRMSTVFQEMAQQNASKIVASDFRVHAGHTHLDQIADLAGFSKENKTVGCSIM